MERHISATVKSLHLIAHVFKQQLVFVKVHLQPASEQTKQELHPGRRDHALGKYSHRVIQKTLIWLKSVCDTYTFKYLSSTSY